MRAKTMFCNAYEIRYDTLIDHDVYNFLRVSLEVPRDQTEIALVVLNGKEIGKIKVQWDENHKKASGWKAYRYKPTKKNPSASKCLDGIFDNVGRAAAAVISDYVSVK